MKNSNSLRKLAAGLALVMLLSGLGLTASAHNFTDVPYSSYAGYHDAINYCYDNEIVQGVTATTFGPERPLTRAMFITFLYRFAGEPRQFADVDFEDVPAGSYYEDAVRWGVYENLIQGISDTHFGPNNPLQKQQLATFLYRFAGNTRGYFVENSGSLNCQDAGDIMGYARIPMYWAVRNGVFSNDTYQYPWSTVLRKDAVLWLWRFGTNVDGIIPGRDDFAFSNDTPSFLGKTSLVITQQHYDMLQEKLTDSDMSRVKYILDNFANNGLCYGMSLAAILDKMGKIDLNGNFAQHANTIYELPTPAISSPRHIMGKDKKSNTSISLLESALTYYQLSAQAVTSIADTFVGTSYYVGGDYVCPNLELLYDKQENGGLALFSYCFSADINTGTKHTVVLYGRPHPAKQYALGKLCYLYHFYDNRYPGQVGSIYVSTDFQRCGILEPGSGTIKQIQHMAYYNGAYASDEMDDGSFSAYDKIDIDGRNNNGVSSSANSTQAETMTLPDTYLYFYVQCPGSFTIADASGKTAVWDNKLLVGELEADIVAMLPGNPGAWVVRVENNGAYTFTSDAAQWDVSLVGSQISQTVRGENIHQITFSEDSLALVGQDMTYEANAMVSTVTDNSVTVSGTGETAANIRLDGTAGSALVETETAGFSIEVQDFGAGISVCSQQFAQDSQVQLNCHAPAVELQVVNPEEARQ